MKHSVKYFVFNKETDYKRGSGENIEISEAGISLGKKSSVGIFFSRLLDSREKKMKWHRLLVDRTSHSEASIRFLLYVSDSRMTEYKGIPYDIGELLANEAIDSKHKNKILEPYLVETFTDPMDTQLFRFEGRYLWFQIILIGQGEQSPKIHKIKIYFPKDSWTMYLPEIYQTKQKSLSFVERFLGIYQMLYQDMSENIYSVAKYFDSDSVDEKILRWLAEWISIDDSYVWTPQKLRILIRNALKLYSIRGTVDYLEQMVLLYTGKKPYIIEHHRIEPFITGQTDIELLTELYGNSKYIFTVIVDMGAVVSNKEYKILTKIIENAKPAHMESNVVILEPFIFLNQHSYLGVNSVLGQYHDFILDGQAAISFTTIS